MHPAQYPMKNIAFTTDRLVLPFTLDAVREIKIDQGAVQQEAYCQDISIPSPDFASAGQVEVCPGLK